MTSQPWSIPGSGGEAILGDVHLPDRPPRGVVIIAHGFKGYKDYGFLPILAGHLASLGWVVHRFNFSHSGMTNDTETFARPDLFELDSWNKQVNDLRAVVSAVRMGTLEGDKLPIVLAGHSRGGAAVLLTAGRFANDPYFPQPAGLITIAAPCAANRLNREERKLLRAQGYLESPSSRTGQTLRIGRQWLDEVDADRPGHDVLRMARHGKVPVLIIHGESDPTVSVDDAREIAREVGRRALLLTIPGGDHVLNTPNPADPGAPHSRPLDAALKAIASFIEPIAVLASR